MSRRTRGSHGKLPIATIWLHTVVGTTACNRNYRLLQTVVEASLSVQNLVQTTVWPTTDHLLKVALPAAAERMLAIVSSTFPKIHP